MSHQRYGTSWGHTGESGKPSKPGSKIVQRGGRGTHGNSNSTMEEKWNTNLSVPGRLRTKAWLEKRSKGRFWQEGKWHTNPSVPGRFRTEAWPEKYFQRKVFGKGRKGIQTHPCQAGFAPKRGLKKAPLRRVTASKQAITVITYYSI